MKRILLVLLFVGTSFLLFSKNVSKVTFINNTDKYIFLRSGQQKEVLGVRPGEILKEKLDVDTLYYVKYKTNQGKVKTLGQMDSHFYVMEPHSIVNTEININIDSDGNVGSMSNMKGQLSLGVCKKNGFRGDINCQLSTNKKLKDLRLTFNQMY